MPLSSADKMAFFHACITSLDIENSWSIFNCHVAGNVENFDILGSMEFARKISGAKAILVMGIRGAARLKALSTTPNSAISRLAKIKPAVAATTYTGENRDEGGRRVQRQDHDAQSALALIRKSSVGAGSTCRPSSTTSRATSSPGSCAQP